jgi:hypothetical protein
MILSGIRKSQKEKEKMNLVPLAESPINLHTGYKYHSTKKHPGLVLKVAGRLFVDMDEWHNLAKAVRDQQLKEAKRLKA